MQGEDELKAFDELGGGAAGGREQRPFTHAEMVACDACLRANAPTRMACIYCGARLPATEQSALLRRPALKRLEDWEQGFNVVLLPGAAVAPESNALEEAAALLRLDASRLVAMMAAGRALPLARASSAEEAELIVARLRTLGLGAEVFADELLTRAPARVRTLDLEEGAVVFRKSPDSAPLRVPLGEVALLVTGRVVSRRVEVSERKTRFGGRSEMVEARELASDEMVLDIYTAGEDADTGFRIVAGGFDYSCLGASKGLTAADNFRALVGVLRGLAKSAVFDEEYARLRPLLADVWPAAEHTESLGLRRESVGRVNAEAVTTVSNETQFTRYARLRQRTAPRARAES